jgi:membrane fusion protein, multidrug efflux system
MVETTTPTRDRDMNVSADDDKLTGPNFDPIPAANASRATPTSGRKRLFAIFGAVLALGALSYGSYWWIFSSRRVSTDNAYVDATSAQITPLISAAVTELRVKDTQHVRAGDVIIVLDGADARLALSQAEAQLGQALRRVQGYFANDSALASQIAAREAEIASARSDLERTRSDYERRKALAEGGAVSAEDLTTARGRLQQATAALNAAVAQRDAAVGSREVNEALISGVPVESNPEVVAARTQLAQAHLNLDRAVIRAPIEGVIAKNSVQLGQRVQVGAALMSIVPVEQAYVNANFKEVQLARVRVGQPVELESDLYGGSVTFHGRVAGLAGGTGSAFSLIPAQNATGNWIKVVQRLPVRIELDPGELRAHPLRVGLSMKATINTTT